MILMLAVALYPLLFQQRYSPLSLCFTFFSFKVASLAVWPVGKCSGACLITIDVSVISWGTADPGFILNHFTSPWWYPRQTTVTLSFTSKGPRIQGGLVSTLTCTWKSTKEIWEKKIHECNYGLTLFLEFYDVVGGKHVQSVPLVNLNGKEEDGGREQSQTVGGVVRSLKNVSFLTLSISVHL